VSGGREEGSEVHGTTTTPLNEPVVPRNGASVATCRGQDRAGSGWGELRLCTNQGMDALNWTRNEGGERNLRAIEWGAGRGGQGQRQRDRNRVRERGGTEEVEGEEGGGVLTGQKSKTGSKERAKS
jgi:hypothetical protein